MSKIKIVNENGELVGKDTQTGETVPVKFGSGIATESLTDATDSQAWETLREVGYENGDVIPIASYGPLDTQTASVSSTSFQQSVGLGRHIVIPSSLVPDPADLQAGIAVRLIPGSDEELFAQFNNSEAAEAVTTTVSSTTTQNVWSGFSDYDPSNPANPERYTFRHRTEPATNSSTSAFATLVLGVKL